MEDALARRDLTLLGWAVVKGADYNRVGKGMVYLWQAVLFLICERATIKKQNTVTFELELAGAERYGVRARER